MDSVKIKEACLGCVRRKRHISSCEASATSATALHGKRGPSMGVEPVFSVPHWVNHMSACTRGVAVNYNHHFPTALDGGNPWVGAI